MQLSEKLQLSTVHTCSTGETNFLHNNFSNFHRTEKLSALQYFDFMASFFCPQPPPWRQAVRTVTDTASTFTVGPEAVVGGVPSVNATTV